MNDPREGSHVASGQNAAYFTYVLTVTEIATALHRMVARLLPGYEAAKARQVFRRFWDTPARVEIGDSIVEVTLPKRAHNPLLLAAGFGGVAIAIPWWENYKLMLRFR